MKKRISYLFLIPFILSVAGCGNNNQEGGNIPTPEPEPEPVELGPVDVVVISGQSNGVGCTQSRFIPDTLGSEKYDEYFNGYSTIQIAYDCWTKDWPASGITFYSQNTSRKNNFVNVTLGQGNSRSTFGPEIGIAEATHEKHANKLFLIKYACGGSNLKDDWLGNKSPMYNRLIDYINLQMGHLEEKGYEPTIRAFCWMQGEGDSYLNYYNVYYENLCQFVSDLRRDLKDLSDTENLPFIDAGIGTLYWDYPEKVNEAKVKFSEDSEYNIYIDTVGAGLHTDVEPINKPDLCHYDSDSQIQLGHLFAEAFEPFLMQSNE